MLGVVDTLDVSALNKCLPVFIGLLFKNWLSDFVAPFATNVIVKNQKECEQ